MKRLLAISDIHGELELFNELLKKIDYQAGEDQLILLGDYVDRGPNPCGVLNRVMELKEEGAIVLRGNHDEMLVAAYHNEPDALLRWEMNGAIHTLKSYDASIDQMKLPQTEIFQKHVNFIQKLDYYYETEDYIFVHAGVQPGVPLTETNPHDFVWIRDEFFEAYDGDKTVIFGHTPTPMLHGDHMNFNVYFGDNKIIGIDGGAVFGGKLNCLELPSQHVYAVS